MLSLEIHGLNLRRREGRAFDEFDEDGYHFRYQTSNRRRLQPYADSLPDALTHLFAPLYRTPSATIIPEPAPAFLRGLIGVLKISGDDRGVSWTTGDLIYALALLQGHFSDPESRETLDVGIKSEKGQTAGLRVARTPSTTFDVDVHEEHASPDPNMMEIYFYEQYKIEASGDARAVLDRCAQFAVQEGHEPSDPVGPDLATEFKQGRVIFTVTQVHQAPGALKLTYGELTAILRTIRQLVTHRFDGRFWSFWAEIKDKDGEVKAQVQLVRLWDPSPIKVEPGSTIAST